ncbi:hypothetical protein ACJOV8_007960 [Formosa sp. 3Alg 14/1]|uniref:hypothetical protein n=1 Tax=Formosa sp. 3Alg 14/1 TaxID=3382190 RepID=UPI0039BEAEC8
MNTDLKPKYSQSIIDYKILWFELSNQYAIVNNGLFYCIDTYFNLDTINLCIDAYKDEFNLTEEQASALYKDINKFLIDRNTPEPENLKPKYNLELNNRVISKSYTSEGLNFKIHVQSDTLLSYIHPQICHLETCHISKPDFWFDIHEADQQIMLFKNNQFIKACETQHFHELQGKFNMELISSLYGKEEHDWIGLFHASTVAKKSESVMLIGTSGSGKSTLTTILAHHGYQLIADDTTPILRADLNTYYFPGGISIKPGAFSIIKPLIPNFDNIPQSFLRAYKGGIKYIAPPKPKQNHLPCKSIVLVNYKKDADVVLDTLDAKTALEILIPDSWISPKPENAKAFLNWISTVTFYKLTYSNNQDAIDIFSTIFKDE